LFAHFGKNGVLTNHTERLIEKELEELGRMHDLLNEEEKALATMERKWMEEKLEESAQGKERMEELSRSAIEPSKMLMNKIFQEKK